MRQERATSGGRIRHRGPLTFGAGVVMVRPLRRKMLPITARSVTQMYGSLYILANHNLLAGHSLGARNPTDHTSCAYSRHGTICSVQAGWELQGLFGGSSSGADG
jgi:hypothetical protein